MDEKKQIEEMAKHLTHCFLNCAPCDKCRAYLYSEQLYNAGFREQSEGEWVLEHETYGEMRCSVCGKECPIERKPDPYKDYQMTDFYVTSPFCPNCGARMKGGAE